VNNTTWRVVEGDNFGGDYPNEKFVNVPATHDRDKAQRRIPVEYHDDGRPKMPAVEQPGDYCGPVMGFTRDKPAVFFLKPNARDPGVPPIARSVHHVISPPHTFTEEPDGTLTIRASLGDMHDKSDGTRESDGWHGYLTKGEWHL
jgi:hypothetical protein